MSIASVLRESAIRLLTSGGDSTADTCQRKITVTSHMGRRLESRPAHFKSKTISLRTRALHIATPRFLFRDSKTRAAVAECKRGACELVAALLSPHEDHAAAIRAPLRRMEGNSADALRFGGEDGPYWRTYAAMFKGMLRQQIEKLHPQELVILERTLLKPEITDDVHMAVLRSMVKDMAVEAMAKALLPSMLTRTLTESTELYVFQELKLAAAQMIEGDGEQPPHSLAGTPMQPRPSEVARRALELLRKRELEFGIERRLQPPPAATPHSRSAKATALSLVRLEIQMLATSSDRRDLNRSVRSLSLAMPRERRGRRHIPEFDGYVKAVLAELNDYQRGTLAINLNTVRQTAHVKRIKAALDWPSA